MQKKAHKDVSLSSFAKMQIAYKIVMVYELTEKGRAFLELFSDYKSLTKL